MKYNGARLNRLLAGLLTVMMLMTAYPINAFAADVWDGLSMTLAWMDNAGNTRTAQAVPVESGMERAYWAQVDASALGNTLTLDVISPDPSYSFYMMDEWGGQTMSFTFQPEMDALGLGYEYAHLVFYSVHGNPADMPVLLYVSTVSQPQEQPPEFEPYPVSVRVNYVTEDGMTLDTQYVECWAGEITPVWASSARVEGYALVGSDVAEVAVDQNGMASPAEVTFVYREVATPTPVPTDVPTPTPVAEVSVPVVYCHVNGDTLDFQEVFLAPGDHAVTANSSKVGGYVPASDTTVYITVYPDGTTNIGSVVFYYEDPAPAEAYVSVYYYHENGTMLDMQELRLTEGSHVVTPASSKTDGYELNSASSVEVTVYPDGTINPGYVQFFYKDAYVAPAEAVVTVNYYHVDRGLLDSQTITLPEGNHVVRANSSAAADYLPLGSTEQSVTVYADGTCYPGTVEFWYEDAYVAPVNGSLNVVYQLRSGAYVNGDTLTLTPGTHTIMPDSTKLNGYVLDGEQSHVVQVNEAGAVQPDTIVFYLRQAEVKVTVHYQDDRGRDVAPSQVYTFTEEGRYTIVAAPEGLSDEYELAPGMAVEVNVDIIGGAASQPDVYFYYQQKPAVPANAVVTIRYFDTYGTEIAPAQSVTLAPGKHLLKPDAANVPAGYELVSDASIAVEVYDNGTFAPQEVAFYYREAKTEAPKATIAVHYRDDRGRDVAQSQSLELPDGTHIVRAQPVDLPAGYSIFTGTADAVEVVVRNGVPSQSQVVFYYQKTQAEPTVFTLPVYYYDTMGNPIASTQYVKIAPGTYAIQANPVDLPQGYELMMESVLTVVVRQDGTTDPEEIAFYYRAPEKRASVIVSYVDEYGNPIAQPFTLELASGYHTIQADASRVPGAYDPQSAKPVQVYVNRDGVANPDHVELIFTRLVVETPIPVGENVYRYASVNDKNVAFRSEPSTAGGNKTVLRRLGRNDKVYVLKEARNDKNEVWAQVIVNGQYGYMMSKFLDMMTQAESDAYAQGSTPAPTFTPIPTATPVPTATPTPDPTIPPLVEAVTPIPTGTPTQVPTATPTATPEPYTGYALTNRVTELRYGISSADMTVIQVLEANELVSVLNQVTDPVTGEVWSIVSTLNNQPGFVKDSALRYITDKEAEPYILYWQEVNKTPEPTQIATSTPEPMQMVGYAVVLSDNVPFRQMQSEFSRIIDNLPAGTVVYVTGQTAGESQYWHSVNYEGRWGYIRTDLVRMMTIAEEEAYLQAQMSTPTPEPVTTNQPFDQHGMSSYGYVDGSSVNWRESPSTKGKKIGELKRYAFCLVLDTEYVNGVTWYLVSYGSKTGYIHGDFFKQMTIAELEDFLGSDEYLQGIANNSPNGEAGKDDVGHTGTGGIVSAEDQVKHENPDIWQTNAPWTPIGTQAPVPTATPTLEPIPGRQTATPVISTTPTPTATFNPLPDVTYPVANGGGDGSGLLIGICVGGLLLLVIGGVFVLVRHQQNKQRIAMRAAARRAQAARSQQQRPHARTTAQGQPRTGAYPNPNPAPQRTYFNQGDNAYDGYQQDRGNGGGTYFRPMEEAFTPEDSDDFVPDTKNPSSQPTGRRTAYQRSKRANGEDNSFDM